MADTSKQDTSKQQPRPPKKRRPVSAKAKAPGRARRNNAAQKKSDASVVGALPPTIVSGLVELMKTDEPEMRRRSVAVAGILLGTAARGTTHEDGDGDKQPRWRRVDSTTAVERLDPSTRSARVAAATELATRPRAAMGPHPHGVWRRPTHISDLDI